MHLLVLNRPQIFMRLIIFQVSSLYAWLLTDLVSPVLPCLSRKTYVCQTSLHHILVYLGGASPPGRTISRQASPVPRHWVHHLVLEDSAALQLLTMNHNTQMPPWCIVIPTPAPFFSFQSLPFRTHQN